MGADAATALERLRAGAESGTLEGICERRGVRLLGAFGPALHAPDPGDLDLGVGFHDGGDLLGLIDDLVALTGFDALDVAALRAHPMTRRSRGRPP